MWCTVDVVQGGHGAKLMQCKVDMAQGHGARWMLGKMDTQDALKGGHGARWTWCEVNVAQGRHGAK